MALSDAPTLGEVESAADTARAVMSEMMDKGPEAPPSEPAASAVDIGKPEASPESAARARDAQGRFVPSPDLAAGKSLEPVEQAAPRRDPAAKPAEKQATTVQAPSEPDAAPQPEDPGDEEAIDPPTTWSAAEHAIFHKLPPETRRFVVDKVTALEQRAAEAEKAGTLSAGIEAILAPRRQYFGRDGLDDVGAVRQLFGLSDFAAQDPVRFVQWFMQNRGIGPEHLFPAETLPGDGGAAAGAHPGGPDLAYAQQVQQRLDNIERYFQDQLQQAERSTQAQVESTIGQFRDAKDDKGRPLHPYFDQVKSLMGAMLNSGARDLKSAYDMACRADPEVSAKIAAAERARAEQELARKNREKAAAARQAGSSVTGTPADRAPPADPGDPRELMRQIAIEKGLIA